MQKQHAIIGQSGRHNSVLEPAKPQIVISRCLFQNLTAYLYKETEATKIEWTAIQNSHNRIIPSDQHMNCNEQSLYHVKQQFELNKIHY